MPGQLSGTFPARLKAAMVANRIGSAKLGEATGISPRLINKYKAGDSEPRDPFGLPSENAHKLAVALDVDVHELVPPRVPSWEQAA